MRQIPSQTWQEWQRNLPSFYSLGNHPGENSLSQKPKGFVLPFRVGDCFKTGGSVSVSQGLGFRVATAAFDARLHCLTRPQPPRESHVSVITVP